MAARVEVRYHHGAILSLTSKVTLDLASKGAQSAQARARRFAPKHTGALAASIRVTLVRSTGLATTFHVGSELDYAAYQEFGTGPITPKSAKVLSFVAGGQRVFAMRTSGVPATHFMKRAGMMITASDFT